MAPTQLQPTSEAPVHKGLSWPDVQALGLVLMILMVINLPLYQSVLQGQGIAAPSPSRIAAAHPAPIKTALLKTVPTDPPKPGVSRLTKTSVASSSARAR